MRRHHNDSKNRQKQLNRRENYRGITLSSAIYKLFELVVLNRIKQATRLYNLNICHHLQNAYQIGLSNLMTSFVLQETVNYNAGHGSKTYCCMLNAARLSIRSGMMVCFSKFTILSLMVVSGEFYALLINMSKALYSSTASSQHGVMYINPSDKGVYYLPGFT